MDGTNDSEVQATARETVQDREAGLAQRRQRDRARREQARSQETDEQREARLAQQRQRDRATREQETAEQREARLASQREHTRASRAHQRQGSRHAQVDANRSIPSDIPLFDQASVHTRMLNFHCKLAAARETVQHREARLAQRRQRDRARREQACSQETAEQREARLAPTLATLAQMTSTSP